MSVLTIFLEQSSCAFSWINKRRGFYEIQYLSVFRKSVEKIQISLKSDKNNGHFTRRPIHIFYNISLISS